MKRRYELRHSEQRVRSAARAFAYGLVTWQAKVLTIILCVLAIEEYLSEGATMLLGILVTAGMVMLYTILHSVIALQASASESFRQLADATVHLELGDGNFKLTSPITSIDMVASEVRELRRYRDFYLLVYRSGGYTSLPLESLGSEGAREIEKFVLDAGGTVV